MILTEADIKVTVFTMYWENSKLLCYYVTMPDGEIYCYKQEDYSNNKTYKMQRYLEPKGVEV